VHSKQHSGFSQTCISMLVSRYSVEATSWTTRIRFSAACDFSVLEIVQTNCGDNQVPSLYPGVKRQEREADNSHRYSAEIGNGGTVTSLPDTSLLCSAWG
jgi:hypothetical protein